MRRSLLPPPLEVFSVSWPNRAPLLEIKSSWPISWLLVGCLRSSLNCAQFCISPIPFESCRPSSLAQEQMSPMSPIDLAKIQQQMMANPELMKMASESMKEMTPADLRTAAQQLRHIRPEEMSEICEKMANASPDEMVAMRCRLDAQIKYELNAAQMLKKQGNELHSQGKFRGASNKYLLAKQNIKGIPGSKARTLLLACSLNLMSCYLRTRQYDDCIKEGSEVLEYDAKNVKALYRRGQAYKELGQLEDAVADLSKAHEASPDDETVTDILRDAKKRLMKEGGERVFGKLKIKEINEEGVSSQNIGSLAAEYPVIQSPEGSGCSTIEREVNREEQATASGKEINTEDQTADVLLALKDDPEAIRSFHNFMSNADPETLDSLSAVKTGEILPNIFKTASSVISKMSPEELRRMLDMASSFPDTNFRNFGPGSVPPDMTPNMFKTASDMISKMSPEDLQKMHSMASTLKGADNESSSMNESGVNSLTGLKAPEVREDSVGNGEASSSHDLFSKLRTAPSEPTASTLAANLQQQMQNQMKDPAMRQMFTSMIKNMSPDMMVNMGEQLGLKLSKEDAEKARQAMSPEALDRMMVWVGRMQSGAEYAGKTKRWLLGRSGMIMAICMLILAVILHRLGFIGS